MSDRHTMLQNISEISFCVNDLNLYLDTHPTDGQTLDLFNQMLTQRKQLLADYEAQFEPLTIDCVRVENSHMDNDLCKYPGTRHFTWVDGPVPWEGGHI